MAYIDKCSPALAMSRGVFPNMSASPILAPLPTRSLTVSACPHLSVESSHGDTQGTGTKGGGGAALSEEACTAEARAKTTMTAREGGTKSNH